MAYKALVDFTDLDTGVVFCKGDLFPVEGLSEERLKELTSIDNKRKEVIIEELVKVEQKTSKKVANQSNKDK